MKKILVISSFVIGLTTLGAQAADKIEVPTPSNSVPSAESLSNQNGPKGLAAVYESAKDHAASLKDNAKSLDLQSLQQNKENLKNDASNLKSDLKDLKEFKFSNDKSSIK